MHQAVSLKHHHGDLSDNAPHPSYDLWLSERDTKAIFSPVELSLLMQQVVTQAMKK